MVGPVLRSKVCQHVPGGLPTAFKCWLQLFFPPSGSGSIANRVPLNIRGERHVLAAKLGAIVADESALQALWMVKGASGWKPCMKCLNCVGKSFALEGGGIVSSSSHDSGDFQRYTDATFIEAADRVQARWAAPGTKASKVEYEKLLGV